jgi:hypothetical protein
VAFYVLAAVAALAAVLSAVIIESEPVLADAEVATDEVALEAAA